MVDRPGHRRGRGALEGEVLAVLAAAGTALTPGQVTERLDPSLAYTTVSTVLSRLHDKGMVSRHRAGRAHAYAFLRDEAARRAREMTKLLEAGRDRGRVLAHFVQELGPQDELLLQRLLREAHEDG
jgi:predicted transcriptional regulator